MNIQIHFDNLNIYKTSRVEGEDQGYKLNIGGYTGDAGDSMTGNSPNNGMKFSTRDRDNDKSSRFHCVQLYKAGGWWFNNV